MTINETVYTTKTAHGHSIYKVRTIDVQSLDDNNNDSTTASPPSDSDTTDSDIEPLEPHDNNEDGNINIDEIGNIDIGSPEEFDSSHSNDIVRQSDDIEVLK